MIYQAVFNTVASVSGKQVFDIPFQSGYFNVKLIHCFVRRNNSTASKLLFLQSDRLPFNLVRYVNYTNNVAFRQVKGLFIDANNTSFTSNGSTAFLNHDELTYEYKNVFLDGKLDFNLFDAGIGTGAGANLIFGNQPPNSVNGMLLTMDITPVKEMIPMAIATSNLYQMVAPVNTAGLSSATGTVLTPYYGNVKIKIIRIDYTGASSVLIAPNSSNVTLYDIRSNNLLLAPLNRSFTFSPSDSGTTAYFGDNIEIPVKTDGSISLTVSRTDGTNFPIFSIGFMISFIIDY